MLKRIISLLISFILFLCLMAGGHKLIRPTGLDQIIVLDSGWTVTYNDTVFENNSLSELRELIGSGTYKGDRIIFKRQLPDLKGFTAPSILFQSEFSAWEIRIDGVLVADYLMDKYNKGEFVGCANNFYTFSTYYSYATFEIEFHVAEDGAYNYFSAPAAGSYQDLLLYFIYNYLYILMSSCFFIIFGVLFLAISIGFRRILPEVDIQIYSALLYIALGIWFLAQFNLLDFIVDTNGHETEIEYISLYMVIALMSFVMGSAHDFLRKKIYLVFAIISTIFATTPIVIHFLGGTHINKFLYLYQINATILFVFMLIMVIKDIRQQTISTSQFIQLVGMSMISLAFIFNVIFLYLEVAGISEQIMLSKEAVPMGTFCMAFTSLVNYYLYISESYGRKKEYESLAHLAYADGLTNIPNRSKYEKYLSDLSKSGEDYCIISLDLNNLKKVNDNISHLMGDKYLRQFSHALEECFNEKGFIARIGGDEFVAILKGEHINDADELIGQLNDAMDRLNKKDSSFIRSVATGYAYKHETDEQSWNAVYLLADKRMYANKADIKIGELLFFGLTSFKEVINLLHDFPLSCTFKDVALRFKPEDFSYTFLISFSRKKYYRYI